MATHVRLSGGEYALASKEMQDQSKMPQGMYGAGGAMMSMSANARPGSIRKDGTTRRKLSKPMVGLTQPSNYLTLKGSFSAVSKPNFASKYALELGSI